MAAEVVVVFENKNARVRARSLAIEMRGREAADAAAYDDEVIDFASVLRRAGRSQKVPSRNECATSNEPGWLPRSPVSAGG